MNKKVSIILVTILIVLFGCGLFAFLRFAKNHTVESKTININVGEKLSKNIEDYISEDNNCELNLDNVNVNKKGKYSYRIKCDDKSYIGTINVK